MLSYQNFRQMWQDEDLAVETFLTSTYWTSAFSEQELRYIIRTILKARVANTFAEFLDAIDLKLDEFSEKYDFELDRALDWVNRKTIDPRSLKRRHVFELIADKIEKMRRRTCVRCGTAFLSKDMSDFCDLCKQEELAEMAQYAKKGVTIYLEVNA